MFVGEPDFLLDAIHGADFQRRFVNVQRVEIRIGMLRVTQEVR
jgi:hypothetical protein